MIRYGVKGLYYTEGGMDGISKEFSSFGRLAHYMESVQKLKFVSINLYWYRILDREVDIAHYLSTNRPLRDMDWVKVTGIRRWDSGEPHAEIWVNRNVRGTDFQRLVKKGLLVPVKIHKIVFETESIELDKIWKYMRMYHAAQNQCEASCDHLLRVKSERAIYYICEKYQQMLGVGNKHKKYEGCK